ncbi:hypothetical protein NC653_011669 [Populus alba x Populus x berolinensis]|uniref:Uncharacterized protein n=1 Tax=Populus alba x Populus x berolinensis TaxID=444605 RepID=A0AAD6R2U6_9ROSI|nr:hypothetical protein NC653_011669 [Populus alba x Populus x berolinensis]
MDPADSLRLHTVAGLVRRHGLHVQPAASSQQPAASSQVINLASPRGPQFGEAMNEKNKVARTVIYGGPLDGGKVKDVLKIRLLTNETRGIVFAGQDSKIQKWKVNARNLPFNAIQKFDGKKFGKRPTAVDRAVPKKIYSSGANVSAASEDEHQNERDSSSEDLDDDEDTTMKMIQRLFG